MRTPCREKESFESQEWTYCHKLYAIYMKEGNCSKALEYLKLADKCYRVRRICSMGSFHDALRLNYEYAVCYDSLGQIDSAITRLTPYMFFIPQRYEAKQYTPIFDYYLKTLYRRYSKKNLCEALEQAIDTLQHECTTDNDQLDDSTNMIFFNIDCSFNFLGCKVYEYAGGIEVDSLQSMIPDYLTREYFQSYVRRCRVYKALFAVKDENRSTIPKRRRSAKAPRKWCVGSLLWTTASKRITGPSAARYVL